MGIFSSLFGAGHALSRKDKKLAITRLWGHSQYIEDFEKLEDKLFPLDIAVVNKVIGKVITTIDFELDLNFDELQDEIIIDNEKMSVIIEDSIKYVKSKSSKQ